MPSEPSEKNKTRAETGASAPKGPPAEPNVAATMAYQSDDGDSVVDAATKQDRDLAFAAAVLRHGKATERELARATANWTIHGDETLADHLVAEGVLAADDQQEIAAAADRDVESAVYAASVEPMTATQAQRTRLETLDPTGRISKLLGAGGSVLQWTEQEDRRIDARYTLLRKLGQGGLGTVWLARDQNLRRYVAVKEITRQSGPDDPALARFRREAEVTGRLEHPGIVPVYQFGSDAETGRVFYAMRFLGKTTLQDAIAEYHERREAGDHDPLLLHQLLTVFVNVCQAVAHAHSRKVIHRDLKPENVALDSFGQVVLLDWGLAKINDETGLYEVGGDVEPGDVHDSGATQAGQVLGTPMFMAPEQASGRLDEIDERTDVYGLGGVLYAILTGLAPHDASYVSRDGRSQISQLFSAIVSQPTKPPREVVSTVAPELDAICRKALAKKRYARYESASDLADDIQRYMAGSTVSAYQEPPREAAKRWVRNHPRLSQAIFLFAAVAVVAVVTAGVSARQAAVSLQQARYGALKELVQELEINLESDAEELAQDVRFITELPPIQQIVALETGAVANGEDEAVWRDRLATIFDGLLRANPDDLLCLYATLQGDEVRELVRSERNAPGDQVRRVPASRLARFQAGPNAERWRALKPGQVILTTGDQVAAEAPTDHRRPLVFIAGSPIYDDVTGEPFGFTVIELEGEASLRRLLSATTPSAVDVYVVDSQGLIALHARSGGDVSRTGRGAPVAGFVPEVAEFFESGFSGDVFADGERIYVRRLRLGPEGSSAIISLVGVISDR